ncbi:MAG: M28 family peptidase, partial [candidate division WOR-3 bacterium]
MKLKLCLVLLVLTAASWAGPEAVLAVDARAGVLEELARAKATCYGRVGRFVLLPEGSQAAAGLDAIPLKLSRGLPLYVVTVTNPAFRPRVRQALTVLLEDSNVMLAQLDETAAEQVCLLGGELFRLPDQPHRLYLPEPRLLPRVTFADTFIQRLCAQVSEDSIRAQIRRLEDFRTRYSPSDSCRSAEQYAFDYFTRVGLDSVGLFSYEVQGDTWRNALGIRWGRVNRDQYVIVCGHMDCISQDPWVFAPGAEDNASGTALTFEAARVLARENFDVTLIFIAFTGEEQGLYGSFYLAQWMRSVGADIIGVLNFDMIAWPGGRFGVAIHCDTASRALGEYQARMAALYTTLQTRVDNEMYGSDQLAFQYFGYRATAGAEYGGFYPYYHTTGDTLGNLSIPLAAEVTKMALAAAASLASSPAPPRDFRLQDLGIGGTLRASWQHGPSPDVAGYKVLWGTEPRVYTDSALLGFVTSYDITGLQNGTRYFATVMAVDSGGREGFPASEQSCVPGTVPLAPAGVVALPTRFGMALCWQANRELDLAGYNLYRRTAGTTRVRLNTALLADTTYRDSGLLSDTMYYYVVTAQDSTGHESNFSIEVRGKPVTLDHGLLLVDETRDGTGQPGSPSDAQQDSFYHMVLRGTRLTDWDCATDSLPLAGDIGPYSTVVWHADDYTQQQIRPSLPGLANYLTHGGRLWYVGWKPILGLYGSSGRYPFAFTAGEFAFDQLHLAGAAQSASPDFVGATGQSGYASLSTDSAKMVPA